MLLFQNFNLIVILFLFLFRHVRRLRHGGEPQHRERSPIIISYHQPTNRPTDHPTDQQSYQQSTEDEDYLNEVRVDSREGAGYFKKGKFNHFKI